MARTVTFTDFSGSLSAVKSSPRKKVTAVKKKTETVKEESEKEAVKQEEEEEDGEEKESLPSEAHPSVNPGQSDVISQNTPILQSFPPPAHHTF